uniref:Uncharacterized protein n=1 Tax=Trypanosoma congolense (strain IL3000) TaxID=1068625 RepID=G0UT11_TRYCI|nr:hypothetical protein, unlikely [Trypanosoma congolense IL3000]
MQLESVLLDNRPVGARELLDLRANMKLINTVQEAAVTSTSSGRRTPGTTFGSARIYSLSTNCTYGGTVRSLGLLLALALIALATFRRATLFYCLLVNGSCNIIPSLLVDPLPNETYAPVRAFCL